MGSLRFITYATGNFIPIAQKVCESAIKVGFKEAKVYSFLDLDMEFRNRNSKLLMESRGAGYWIWKPQIILQELRTLKSGDILVYSDAGRNAYNHFRIVPTKLIRRTMENGYLLSVTLPQHGPLIKWTKRDCLIRMEMDKKDFLMRPQIQATWSFWAPAPNTFKILEEWLEYACDPHCISDERNLLGQDNYKEFIEHRHDQSILSLLAYKNELAYLDYEDSIVYKILSLRLKSRYTQRFLTRIEDAELIERGHPMIALIRSFLDLRRHWSQSITDGRVNRITTKDS